MNEIGDDDEVMEVPISAIEHFSYCPRQCALIHVEQTYEENVFTMRGKLAHERVDAGEGAVSRGVRTLRAIPLWCERLAIRGKADAVEMRKSGPYPIEYKVGKPHGNHAALQLCAQALCLEEMVGVAIPSGAIYYHAVRQRDAIVFDAELRAQTEDTIASIRRMLKAQELPGAIYDARCRNCSLINACLPYVVTEPARIRGLQGALFQAWEPGQDDV